MTELAKSFEPATIEARWAPEWERSGAFVPPPGARVGVLVCGSNTAPGSVA
jgi:hypothetical protein